jgi:hypothetical protein
MEGDLRNENGEVTLGETRGEEKGDMCKEVGLIIDRKSWGVKRIGEMRSDEAQAQ